MEDLLGSEIGKNDYDWLLTPPGTPRVPALEVSEKTPSSNILPKRAATRSSSTTRASRLSVSQTENGHSTAPTRPARSNSVNRPSIQSTLMSSNNRTSVLNTSISSVSSRPTTTSRRSSTVVAPKQSVPPSHPVPARSSTPVKTRPSTPAKTRPSTPAKTRQITPNSSSDSAAAKTTSTHSSRPSTPNSRSRIMPNSSSGATHAISRPSASVGTTNQPWSSSGNVPGISRATSLSSSSVPSMSRSSSRSSTPTRQPAIRSSAPAIGRSPSVGRSSSISSFTSVTRPAASSGRNSAPSSAPSSRPSSPNPRPRAPVRPLDIPDFPNETPPNLRTKLPERPLSAGRSRPGMALGIRSTSNTEPLATSSPVKISVPAVSRSKFSDASSKTPTLTNGHQNRQAKRSVIDSQPNRLSRPVTGTDNGFGRSISKKSLDMAIKHMDIRQNLSGIRGASLFPQSIRSAAAKARPVRVSDPGHTISNGDRHYIDNGSSVNGHLSGDSNGALSRNGGSSMDSPDRASIGTKETLSELDIYGSSRYEAMLLREDVRNTSWLHGFDEKPDQSPLFDHRFEPLPEPFSPL
ncbi:endochitinase A-like [Phragmites australis]|uniref:endochitinase A-like n=1 Tax=Phragmites australis TaxID=29695 RepID=UPI002D76A15C|nr:endochitinase A-like [Phragmites australis]XP_062231669.1 endochitinase A-like [Phragmites australis]